MVVSEVVHPLPSHPQAISLTNFVARTPATGIEEEEMTSNKSFVCMCQTLHISLYKKEKHIKTHH
jgi:hypothetical protein